ncbi:hypothetical protein LCGC14_0045200 [marine sediment metagenome]|jgi:hypothetical protein|uniref:Uncharacterized protein n=2 Tax=root TaxID=1 RepID=A0A7V1BHY1_9RHOB|nr:hypothetical protein [Sulfitobacter litoralis]HDZ53564.1 hypothetical protein [Sulfitobacter litoralis]
MRGKSAERDRVESRDAAADRRLSEFDLYAKLEEGSGKRMRLGPLATLVCLPIMLLNPFYVTAVAGYVAYQRLRKGKSKGAAGYASDASMVVVSVVVAFLPVYLLWSEYQSQMAYQKALQNIEEYMENRDQLRDPDNRTYDI